MPQHIPVLSPEKAPMSLNPKTALLNHLLGGLLLGFAASAMNLKLWESGTTAMLSGQYKWALLFYHLDKKQTRMGETQRDGSTGERHPSHHQPLPPPAALWDARAPSTHPTLSGVLSVFLFLSLVIHYFTTCFMRCSVTSTTKYCLLQQLSVRVWSVGFSCSGQAVFHRDTVFISQFLKCSVD